MAERCGGVVRGPSRSTGTSLAIRRRWTLSGVFAGCVMAVLLAVAVPVAGAQTGSQACGYATALVEARQLDAAMAAYLGSAAGCDGAEARLAGLNDQRLARDRSLAEAERAAEAATVDGVSEPDAAAKVQQARLAYVAALAIDAASTSAADGLAALDVAPGSKDPFAGSRALLAAGLREDAKTQLGKELAGGNKLGDAPADADLRGLVATGPGHWWDAWKSFLTDVGTFLGWLIGVVLALVLAVVVVAAGVNMLLLEWRRRGKQRDLLEPGTGRVKVWWRRLTQPRINVVAGDGDGSKMFAIRVRETLRRLNGGPSGGQLRFASVPEQELNLAELGDIDARLKPIAAALTYVLRRDTVTITLSTGADDDTHPRIGVEAVARKTEGRTASFTSPSGVAKADAPILVGVAAAWSLFSAEEIRPRLRDGGDFITTYGTDDQRSYSAYLAGDAARRAGDLVGARASLVASVAHDGGFDRAKLDLGAIEQMMADPEVRDIGLHRLLYLRRISVGAVQP
jgi:hypothetical protein